jgi:2-polyprenyl-3-methyl-5-hydroxy-6-metoxy-1,4-benzoquinol methylase
MNLTYNPDVFRVRSIDEAKAIILTAEDIGVEQRWQTETPYLISLIREQFPSLDANSTVIDYGCGIGRLSRELIAQTGCRVVGIDISSSMRALAASYVDSDRFFACSPEMFDWVAARTTFDLAIAVWVLQHTLRPADDVARIRQALRLPNGGFFLVNNHERRVPTREMAWADDGVNIRAMVGAAGFAEQASGSIAEASSAALANVTFWASYHRHS